MRSTSTNRVLAQVPTLETPDGGVFESNAIARYVARLADKGLFGASTYEEVGFSVASFFPFTARLHPHSRRFLTQSNNLTPLSATHQAHILAHCVIAPSLRFMWERGSKSGVVGDL